MMTPPKGRKRKLLPLTMTDFRPVIEHVKGFPEKTTAYFATRLAEQLKVRGKSAPEFKSVHVNVNDPADVAWLEVLRGHYATKGFTVMDPDDVGYVEVRFYTTGAPGAVE